MLTLELFVFVLSNPPNVMVFAYDLNIFKRICKQVGHLKLYLKCFNRLAFNPNLKMRFKMEEAKLEVLTFDNSSISFASFCYSL